MHSVSRTAEFLRRLLLPAFSPRATGQGRRRWVFQSNNTSMGSGSVLGASRCSIRRCCRPTAHKGDYVIRMKAPAGYKVAPHVHPHDENVTVLSGMSHIGFGDKFDEGRRKRTW